MQPESTISLHTFATDPNGGNSSASGTAPSLSTVSAGGDASSKEIDLSGSAAAPQGPMAPPTGAPEVVQTQDYNFKIITREVTTATSYVYVTPAGNYSFNKVLPWSMSYTSLWGNMTQFSTFGIEEAGAILLPGVSGVTTSQTSISVNSSELTPQSSLHGYLSCTYDFSGTPEKTSCNYRRVGLTDFNIFWTTSGNYVRDNNTTYQASIRTDLTLIGDRLSATVGSTPNSAKWHMPLILDWSDYGPASLYYGEIAAASSPYYGILVKFSQDVARVDPTVVQTNACGQQNPLSNGFNDACSFSSSVTSGDLVVSAIGVYDGNDPRGSVTGNWNIQDSAGYSFTRGPHVDGPGVVIFYAIASSTHTEVTSIANTTTITGNVYGQNYLIEVSGVSGLVYAISTGSSTCTSSCGDHIITTTSSTSFPSYQFAFGFGGTLDQFDGLHSIESGYTHLCWTSCDPYAGSNLFEAIYSTSGVSSPTSFTQYSSPCCSGGAVMNDVGIIFAGVTQPLTATLNTIYGGSAQTVTISGCSASPSTFSGDGNQHNIVMLPSCTYTMTLPTGYQWTSQSSGTSCSSGTCSSFAFTYERSPVTQPLKATLSGSGSTQTISVSGCSVSPTSFTGDGNSHSVTASPSCGLIITTPAAYSWQGDGSSETVSTCSSGTCSTSSWNYVILVTQPIEASLGPGGGSLQNVTISGCGRSPTTFAGDAAKHNITLDASCDATISLPAGYSWMGNGTTTPFGMSCPLGLCTVFAHQYVKTHPYIGGYMNGTGTGRDEHLREAAVKVTVSFRGTPSSDLQSEA